MPQTRKLLIWLVVAAGIALVVFAILLAMPVPVWRTGRLPAPPLPVVEGGPSIEPAERVWIDTDAACGAGRYTDPDDCFALLLLVRAPNIEIVGVSTVFGNADLEVTDQITRLMADRIRADGGRLPTVLRGAESPVYAPTAAQEGLQLALADGPLSILALGPLTNVAAALKERPDLQERVTRIVAVMGRRPGHMFHPSEGSGEGMLFGHGPMFRDLNFDKDRGAATDVLAMHMPMSLIPYDVARKISVTQTDLNRISRSGEAGGWVAARAQDWLTFWNIEVGQDGFYPFDLVAADYLLEPELFNCARAAAWVDRDVHLNNFWFFDPVALQVGLETARPATARAESTVIYCADGNSSLHPSLMDRLTANGERSAAE